MTDLNISARVGAVVIGRNEGERLILCLTSLGKQLNKIVYVDSGSTDNSLENAAMMDIEVINLNLNQPFTAARARNEGFRHLIQVFPEVEYVQFVDGDCEVVSTWFNESIVFSDSNQEYAAICVRRRERSPEQTIYNLMCEWFENEFVVKNDLGLCWYEYSLEELFRDSFGVNGFMYKLFSIEDIESKLYSN
jgi:glycosyltransferase involved in cell wall biosynthesis